MQSTFKRGVHPAANKGLSDKKNIVFMPPPSVVYISTAQHIGKAAKPIVAKGDRVIEGQKIAEADGFISAPVFSSVTGTVKEIKTMNTPLAKAEHIIIERDETSEETFRLKPLGEKQRTRENILERIKECGIVGMGGAGFPTHVKLQPKDKVDTFIINAAECEPYITCDYRILLEYTEPFLRGALYMAKAVGLDKVYIGIEDNKTDAANFVSNVAASKGYNVEVKILKSKYPQGAEKQLIYAMTGRKVPTGALPSAVGAVVDNVHTALSVCLAVEDGQPLYKRIMTVSGGGITEPKNFWAAGGTQYGEILVLRRRKRGRGRTRQVYKRRTYDGHSRQRRRNRVDQDDELPTATHGRRSVYGQASALYQLRQVRVGVSYAPYAYVYRFVYFKRRRRRRGQVRSKELYRVRLLRVFLSGKTTARAVHKAGEKESQGSRAVI